MRCSGRPGRAGGGLRKTKGYIMHDQATRDRFVELRAQGWSLDRIANEIHVTKRTLVEWQRQLAGQINTLRQVANRCSSRLRRQRMATHRRLSYEKTLPFLYHFFTKNRLFKNCSFGNQPLAFGAGDFGEILEICGSASGGCAIIRRPKSTFETGRNRTKTRGVWKLAC